MDLEPSSGSSSTAVGGVGGTGRDGVEGGETGGDGDVRPVVAMEDSPDSNSEHSRGGVVRGEGIAAASPAAADEFNSGGDGEEGDRGDDVEEDEGGSDLSLGDYVDAEDGEDGDDISMSEGDGEGEVGGEGEGEIPGGGERASDHASEMHHYDSSDSSSSSSSSSSSAPSPRRRRRVIPSAPARDHTYLPGTSHPIYPPELIRQRSHRRRTSSFAAACGADRSSPNRRELAVLELPSGTILFPGSTIPLRLRNPKWVDYLNRCIESQTRDWAANSSGGNDGGVVGIDESHTTGGGGSGPMHEEAAGYQQVDREAVAIGILPTRKDGGGGDNDGGTSSPRPMVGRIGTVAIVTSVSREESTEPGEGDGDNGGAGGAAGPNRRRRRQQQIVATALGTCRFRIVSSLNIDDDDEERRTNPRYRSWGDMADRHLFLVDVIEDEELPLPPTSVRRRLHPRHQMKTPPGRGNGDGVNTSDECGYGTSAAARVLGMVTPTPSFAWELACPWRLAWQIRRAVGSSPTWSGLRANLPAADGTVGTMGPTPFSFWMAANLPLAESERIDLLETHCTSKRLTFILRKVEGENDRSICCVQCGAVVSRMGQMVTVPGAEGTAGAYVNEHGFVHQTVTLRSVEPESVLCIGAPHTKDSWFPGYSWTMAYCNACYCHLGWKFLPAEEGDGASGNGRQSSRGMRSRLRSWRRRRTTSSSSCDDASQEGRMSEIGGDGGQGQEEDLPLFWGLSAASVAESTSDSDAQRDSRNTSTLRRLIVALAGGGGFNVEYDESADEINVDEVEE